MKVGEKPNRPDEEKKGQGGRKAVGVSPQKNTLKNYFRKA